MIEEMKACGIIPVIKIAETDKAEKLAEALLKGGIHCAEITFRAEKAACAIDRMLNKFPDMIVGAGTILNLNDAKLAIKAGAKFIVSPGFDEVVVNYALERNILVIPGCITPSEIQKAIKLDLKVVKFFPAEQFGGINSIRALSAPFPQIRFLPTGGISLNNLAEYMKEKSVLACGGTFMVKEELIRASQWETIYNLSSLAVDTIKNIEKAD